MCRRNLLFISFILIAGCRKAAPPEAEPTSEVTVDVAPVLNSEIQLKFTADAVLYPLEQAAIVPKIAGLAIGIVIALWMMAFWDARHADMVYDNTQVSEQICQDRFVEMDRHKRILETNEGRHARSATASR